MSPNNTPDRPPFHKTTEFFVVAVLAGCAVFISLACTIAAAFHSRI